MISLLAWVHHLLTPSTYHYNSFFPTFLGCTGLSLQTVFECNFSSDNCGLHHPPSTSHSRHFNWSRSGHVGRKDTCGKETPADMKQMEKTTNFLKEVMSREENFIYSVPKPCVNGKCS